jgi:hypothetical protein
MISVSGEPTEGTVKNVLLSLERKILIKKADGKYWNVIQLIIK